ncbi:hypothetical protein [Antrihabitans sp. YC2-6]|nr:hypothetical protein [Antrihabitans sp. YC2-6]MBJ8346448.1 hypothetical protein [Antrihabitans sp. YC2-6]
MSSRPCSRSPPLPDEQSSTKLTGFPAKLRAEFRFDVLDDRTIAAVGGPF